MDTCPICGENVPDGTAQCPKCEAPLEGSEPTQDNAPPEGFDLALTNAAPDKSAKPPLSRRGSIGCFGKFCLNAGIIVSILSYIAFAIMAALQLSGRANDDKKVLLAVALPVGFILTVANVLVYNAALSFYEKQAAPREKHDESSTR